MSNRKLVLKTAALASSVSLAAAYVLYQAGIIHPWGSPSAVAAPVTQPANGDSLTAPGGPSGKVLFSGSKSGHIGPTVIYGNASVKWESDNLAGPVTSSLGETAINQYQVTVSLPTTKPSPPVLMGGSKSLVLSPAPVPVQSPALPSQPVLMLGSKSGVLSPPPPVTQPARQPNR